MGLLELFTKTVGVDPGSQNLRIVHDDEIIFNEPTELSFSSITNRVTGFGNKLIDSESNIIIRPIHTVIADFHGFEYILRNSIKESLNEKSWIKSVYIMYFSLPISATEVDKRACRDSCEHAGGKEIFMIHQPITSAISMKLLFEKKDFVLMDISASKVSVTVFSNSEQIATGTIRMGAWKLQNALRNYIFRKHNLKISTSESETILANLSDLGDVYEIKHTSISTKELKEILVPYFAIIDDQIQETLELASSNPNFNKILSNGFFITGGGSKINYIIENISILEKVRYKKSPTPLLDNIIGLKEVMKKPSLYESYLMR